MSGGKGILPVFIYCGFRKLEGGRLVISWVGGVGEGEMVLEARILASEEG